MNASLSAPERPSPRIPPPAPSPSGLGRALLGVAGGIAALLSLLVLAAGGALLWVESEQDDSGYLSTGVHRVATPGAALATEDLDVDLDGAGGLLDAGDLGTVRVQARSASGEPIFVGVARSAEVEDYLRGVARATVTDIDVRPLTTELREVPGRRAAAPPAAQRIWRASVTGSGERTLDWDVEDGEWSIVVMNADGSPGVRADVRGGLRIPSLAPIGWGLLAGGTLLGAGALALLVLGLRAPAPPRPPSPRAPAPGEAAQPVG